MDKGDYDLMEEAYQTSLSEMHRDIDKKYAEIRKEHNMAAAQSKAETQKNLALKQKLHGVREQEKQDMEKANERKEMERQAFFEKQNARDKERAADFAETQVFGKKWGRLEAREAAYGSQDHIVTSLKAEKLIEDQQKEAEREKIRYQLDNPHPLELSKGKQTQRFNDRDR